jgi:hypothetical protein
MSARLAGITHFRRKRCEGGRARDLAEEMARLPEFRDNLDARLWRDLVALARQRTYLSVHSAVARGRAAPGCLSGTPGTPPGGP